jgi:hypothetical protein
MPQRKNASLAKAMSKDEAPYHVVISGKQTEVRHALWESEVYQLYDQCSNCFFSLYNSEHILIFSQTIL